MNLLWFTFALSPAILFAFSNLVDQFISRKWTAGSPLTFLTLASLACFPIILGLSIFVDWDEVISPAAFLCVAAVLAYNFAMVPYLKAIELDDVSNLAPFALILPFFVALLGYIILGETLSLLQVVGGMITVIAAGVSLVNLKTFHVKWRAIAWRLSAIFIFAIENILLRIISPDFSWVTVTFWYTLSYFCMGPIIIACHTPTRTKVFETIAKTKGQALYLSGAQQCLDFFGVVCVIIALSFPVAAAITTFVRGLLPFIAYAMSAIGAKIFPEIYQVDLSLHTVLFKAACFRVMIGGLYLVLFH